MGVIDRRDKLKPTICSSRGQAKAVFAISDNDDEQHTLKLRCRKNWLKQCVKLRKWVR